MKKARKMIVILLSVAMLLCNGVFTVSASQGDEEPVAGTYVIGQERYLTDMNGNVYGATNWGSLEAAKAKYGPDWTYGTCSVYYAGSYYNYYYCFSDGSRMYFGVV